MGKGVEPPTKFSKEGGLSVSIFRQSGDLNFKTFSFAAHPGDTSGDSELSKLKKTGSLSGNGCRQKCLDNSLHWYIFFLWISFNFISKCCISVEPRPTSSS